MTFLYLLNIFLKLKYYSWEFFIKIFVGKINKKCKC